MPRSFSSKARLSQTRGRAQSAAAQPSASASWSGQEMTTPPTSSLRPVDPVQKTAVLHDRQHRRRPRRAAHLAEEVGRTGRRLEQRDVDVQVHPVDALPTGQSTANVALGRPMNAASRRRGSSGRSPTPPHRAPSPTCLVGLRRSLASVTLCGMTDRKGLGWGKWREGVVIGVCSGGIVAILTGGFGCIGRSFEKREQVQYLANVIDGYRSRIYTATDLEFRQEFTTRDQLRRVYFDDMVKTVNSVLVERSTRLSYDEETEVRLAFGPLELYGDRVLGEGIYDGIFERFDSIEWLGLRRTVSPR